MKTDSELLCVLRTHALRYPQMQPRDAVKLLYQNEFGGGHLIRDEKSCLERLLKEVQDMQEVPCPFLEDIGGGMVRVHLSGLQESGMSPEQLCRCFICSAALHKGTLPSFLEKLSLLREHLPELGFGFSAEALDAFLADYRSRGCPMVSHSEIFRAAYRPAYRVVRRIDLESI